MRKNLSYFFGLLLVGGFIYLISSGLLSTVLGYLFLALGIVAPFLLSYFIHQDLFFPHWVTLVWVGLMVATVGVLAEPGLLLPVGYLICPEGYTTPEVGVESTQLYEGATNTSATLFCRGTAGLVESNALHSLGVAVLLYLFICLPLLLVAAVVSKLRHQAWGPIKCFALSIILYSLLVAGAWLSPGLPVALRSAVQKLFIGT